MAAVEWNELCRLCANKANSRDRLASDYEDILDWNSPKLIAEHNIDSNTSGNLVRYNSFMEAIFAYTGIQISFEEAYPRVICGLCAKKIEDFDNFVDSCLNVQKYFQKIAELYPDSSQHRNIQNIKSEFSINNSLMSCEIKQENDILVKEEMDLNEDYSNSFFDNGYEDDEFSLPLITFQKNNKKKIKKKKILKQPKLKIKKKDLVLKIKKNDTEDLVLQKDDCNHTIIYSCDRCSHITKSEKALERHKMKHIPKSERIFSCASCPKTFTSKENLKSHERVHIPLFERYNYECDICGNKFTTKSAVVGHKRAVHEKIKRYICDICGYACSTGGELIQHRAIHSDEKQFQCNRCPKKFKTGSNLKAHLDTHDTTSYPCSLCEKVLNSRRTLRKHMLVHEDVCRHVCSFCNKAFKRRQTLKVHLTSHTGDTPIQCPWCPQKFAYNSACRTHKQRCHHEEMAQLASGQIQLPLPQQNSNNISSMINPSTVRNITVHDLGIQSLSVQEVPVETITLQNMNIMPQYEINLPPKIESAD